MIEQITESIYRNSVFLKGSPLKSTNSYIVISESESLIVDTAFNISSSVEQFFEGIKETGVDLETAHVLVTHMHSDHSGLMGYLSDKVKRLSMGALDAEIVEYYQHSGIGHILYNRHLKMFGISADDLRYSKTFGFDLMPGALGYISRLYEGDIINVGKFSFEVIHTPGHTPGHICLYERAEKIMFTGDHVLDEVTPNVSYYGARYGDMLEHYLNSLEKIKSFDADLILTGHLESPSSLSECAESIIRHQTERLEEVAGILKGRCMTVAEVACEMMWPFRNLDWSNFTDTQKWFSVHETVVYLENLVNKSAAEKECLEGTLYYSICL